MNSEALVKLKATGNVPYIYLSPQPVNDNLIAEMRIYRPIRDYSFLWRIINSPGAQFLINPLSYKRAVDFPRCDVKIPVLFHSPNLLP